MNIAFLQISNTQLLRTLLVLEVGHCTSATVKLTKLIASLHIYCTFSSNTIPPSGNGAAINVIKILGYILHVSPKFETIFQIFSFANNSLLWQQRRELLAKETLEQQWIYIISMERVTSNTARWHIYVNSTRSNNTALSLVDSNLVLEGSVLFDGNFSVPRMIPSPLTEEPILIA